METGGPVADVDNWFDAEDKAAEWDQRTPVARQLALLKRDRRRLTRIRLDSQSTCRHTASMRIKTDSISRRPRSRQIVGFSLPPELAVEVKTEAARRNVTLRKLFDEIWQLYKKKKAAGD